MSMPRLQGDKSEFYDLQTDPFELENKFDDPAFQDMIKQLQVELNKVREPANLPTPVPDGNEAGTP